MKNDEIFSLIEQFDFESLSKQIQIEVLKVMSKETYTCERETILEARSFLALADNYVPKPLLIKTKTTHFLASPIPLYQALVGIAAVVLIMLLIFPIKRIELGKQPIKYVTLYDTLKTEIIKYDTIDRIIEKPVVREKIVYVNHSQDVAILKEAPRLLEVPRSNQDMSFSRHTIQNKGVSMKDDTLLFTLPKVF